MFKFTPIYRVIPYLSLSQSPLRRHKQLFLVLLIFIAATPFLSAADTGPRERPGSIAEAKPEIPLIPEIKSTFDPNAPRWVYSPLPTVPVTETSPKKTGNPQEEAELAGEPEGLTPLLEEEAPNSSPFLERDFHRERDFLRDSETFNDQVKELNRLLNERWQEFDKELKNRIGDQENLVREVDPEWRQKRVDAPFYRLPDAELSEKTFADDQYLSDRSRLDLRRMDDWDTYQAYRNDLQERMLNYNRASDEYLRLQKNLNDLDQRQAARERDYEREYRNLDVDYSLGRW